MRSRGFYYGALAAVAAALYAPGVGLMAYEDQYWPRRSFDSGQNAAVFRERFQRSMALCTIVAVVFWVVMLRYVLSLKQTDGAAAPAFLMRVSCATILWAMLFVFSGAFYLVATWTAADASGRHGLLPAHVACVGLWLVGWFQLVMLIQPFNDKAWKKPGGTPLCRLLYRRLAFIVAQPPR